MVKPQHPGEILAEQLVALKMNGSQLAEQIHVPKNRIYQILDGKRSITADTAIRLGKFFGMEAERWLHFQNIYDLALLHQSDEIDLNKIRPHQPIAQSSVHALVG